MRMILFELQKPTKQEVHDLAIDIKKFLKAKKKRIMEKLKYFTIAKI
jgi:hypothetical protein